ncbi:MAG: PQQ-like beta-propeller repeat protein [Myxococcales bacterium]|nr:MAG: PQQ-like beta-propeller repeat protein [Myxococcales bacterium]
MKKNRAALAFCLLLAYCGGVKDSYGWPNDRRSERTAAGTNAFVFRWAKTLVSKLSGGGPYAPVELSAAALDPEHDRVYIGTSEGRFWALSGGGSKVYHYNASAAIQSKPAFDPDRDELYFGTEDAVIHALNASSGMLRWRAKVKGPVHQTPVLAADRLFVVTDSDQVIALSRNDGKEIWSYRREAPDGFAIAGRAGLLEADGKIITGFTDGMVVALDPVSGNVLWERDTSVEVEQPMGSPERFVDIDTTPVQVDDVVYVASFSGGVFAIELSGGGVRWHQNEWTGITEIVKHGDHLLVSSSDHGLIMVDLLTKRLVWKKKSSAERQAELRFWATGCW